MKPPKYNFYVAKRVRYMYLTRNTGINSSGEIVSLGQIGRWSSNIMALPPGSHVVMTVDCTTSYSAVFFYDSARVFISSRLFRNQKSNKTITPPDGAAYYAVTFANEDISNVYKDTSSGTEEVSFIYLAQTVLPHYKELSKKYAKENGQEFFRTSLDGKITLFGHDFEYVYESDIEDQFLFLIEKHEPATDDAQEQWLKYFRGEFSKTDCKFDYERKRCELGLSPKDEYTDVLAKYEDTYDLIKLAPKISHINLHKRSLMQIYISGANSISNFFGGTYWEGEVAEVVDSHDKLVNTYHFANIANANEFYVEGTGDSNIDGIYAGLNGVWYNNKGYEAAWEVIQLQESAYYGFWLIIRKTGTTAVLYRSKSRVALLETSSVKSVFIVAGATIPMVDATVASGNVVFTISTVFTYRVYRRLLCDVASIEDSEGTKALYDLPLDDFAADNRNYKKCIGFEGGSVYCTSEVTTTPTKYGINDSGKYFTNQFLPLSFGSARPLPICRSTWANASVWFAYDSYYQVWEPQIRKLYTLEDNYSIADVIKVLLNQIDPTIKHEATAEYSQFLYGDTNPIGPDRFYIYLTQKTNVLKGNYDQPAQKAEAKLADIMGMLRDCFRCYWFIEDGKFRIEHVWFFINGGSYSTSPGIQLDFTGAVDQFNKKSLEYFQSEVEYDKSELARRYEFNWMDDATELFGGVILDVQSNYVQKDKIEDITPDQFSSDVDYMLFNPSAFSNDGFALLCPVKNGDTYELPILTATLLDENRQSYQAIAQNWYASWAYLTRTFYMRDMPARLIKSNVSVDFAASVKMCMTHSVEFPSEHDIDALKLINTRFGSGKVEEYSVNLDTRQVKVKLAYRPK